MDKETALSLIESAKEVAKFEERQRIRGIVEGMKRPVSYDYGKINAVTEDEARIIVLQTDGYNKALSDILEALEVGR